MRRRKNRGVADIDITPLIDVLFMLIIFFVLTASFVQGKLDVKLPQGDGDPSEARGAVVLTITKEGRIYWEGLEISRPKLAAAVRMNRGREILVAGDEGVPYGAVASILSLLRDEGASSAGLLLSGGGEK